MELYALLSWISLDSLQCEDIITNKQVLERKGRWQPVKDEARGLFEMDNDEYLKDFISPSVTAVEV